MCETLASSTRDSMRFISIFPASFFFRPTHMARSRPPFSSHCEYLTTRTSALTMVCWAFLGVKSDTGVSGSSNVTSVKSVHSREPRTLCTNQWCSSKTRWKLCLTLAEQIQTRLRYDQHSTFPLLAVCDHRFRSARTIFDLLASEYLIR